MGLGYGRRVTCPLPFGATPTPWGSCSPAGTYPEKGIIGRPDHHEKFLSRGASPGGPEVTNLPCNAGNVSLFCGLGTKIPHATGQLSPWAKTKDAEGCDKDPMCSS